MTQVGRSVRTDTATITLVAEHIVEQRVFPDARLTNAAIERCVNARRILTSGKPCALLVVIPESVPVEPASANVDHHRKDSIDRSIIALAVVAMSATMSAVCKFYFRYYPQAFETRVFDMEEEAMAWLVELSTGQVGK